MEKSELLKRRFCELAERASGDGYKTHTYFLRVDELALLEELAHEKKANPQTSKIGEATYFAYGGNAEAERKVLFFLPDFLSAEDEQQSEENGETFSCLHIEGKKAAYAENLDHRDYLGALMSLGYEREQFGDILVAGGRCGGVDGSFFIRTLKPHHSKSSNENVQNPLISVSKYGGKDPTSK